MILKTGFGVFIKNGKKLRKFELAPGEHPNPIGFTYEEVSSRAELDKIVLDKSDEQIAHEIYCENRKNLRIKAVEKLKTVVGLNDDEIKSLFGG